MGPDDHAVGEVRQGGEDPFGHRRCRHDDDVGAAGEQSHDGRGTGDVGGQPAGQRPDLGRREEVQRVAQQHPAFAAGGEVPDVVQGDGAPVAAGAFAAGQPARRDSPAAADQADAGAGPRCQEPVELGQEPQRAAHLRPRTVDEDRAARPAHPGIPAGTAAGGPAAAVPADHPSRRA
ncbi:hypothetical protein [Frankia sp. ArI3]|uniref:hypothetical protein n=1 Tax=Frankia sp. ArI3 TaxID=1858 RepID=UPI0021025BF8|nr:hypothetical protein [Frankia sp. ArI3]